MKVPTSLNLPTWVLVVAVVLLLTATSAITYWLTPKSNGLDTSIQDLSIQKSDSRTKQLEIEATSLTKQLHQLQTQPREIEYRYRTAKSKSDATVEIDSVINSLDFNGQAEFFSNERSRLDSIRREYTGGNY